MATPAAAKFFARVLSPTGSATRRVIDSSLFLTVPKVVREINKPAGELSVDLALPWDDFGYGSASGINLYDLVKIYAVNADNPTGLLIFQGHIEEITGSFDSNQNHVSLRLFPIDALFGRSLWKDADYTVAYAAADFDTILGDAITDVNTIYGATFFTPNLGNPGLSITQDFVRVTHAAAIANAAKSLLATWYWRIRADGQIDLAQFNDSTADHTFVVGLHVDTVRVVKSLLETKNKILVSWGGSPTDSEYTDATSVTAYGRRMSLITDPNIGDSGTSDTKGNGEKARLKDIFTKTSLVVNATYAIETIRPGDTCRIVNVSENTSQMLTGTLRIVRVEYDGSLARLSLADVVDNFGRELGKLVG